MIDIDESKENLYAKNEEFYKYNSKTWSYNEELATGIFVYHDLVPQNIMNDLNSVLFNNSNNYSYSDALVGYGMKIPEYRSCQDFKYKKENIKDDNSIYGEELKRIWDELYNLKSPAVKNYSRIFNIGSLEYWEAMKTFVLEVLFEAGRLKLAIWKDILPTLP